MFKKNKAHMQPRLLSAVSQLSEKHRQRLENSWASVFYREVFCRIDEEIFSVLYADLPSRPNVAVNVLVGFEILKAGFGWSDEEGYDEFTYNLQVRYALGYGELGEGDFDLRTLYYFRERLNRYMQESGVNLLAKVFEQVTDEQVAAFKLKTGIQRMDSTLVSSNIGQWSRLQFLVVVLQRVHRMLSEADRASYEQAFEAYVKEHAGHYVYRLKKGDFFPHLQRIGEFMQQLLADLKAAYQEQPTYQMLERVFHEHYRIEEQTVKGLRDKELSPQRLLSPDDFEASLRGRRNATFSGYAANLTESAEPQNPFQLVTKVQVAPNNVDDPQLLLAALPDLKARTALHTLYTDGGFGSPQTDLAMITQHVTHIPTAIRGAKPNPQRLNLSDFDLQFDEAGTPIAIQCPGKQHTPVEFGNPKKGFVARFDPQRCSQCTFAQEKQCPARPVRKNPLRHLYFLWKEAWVAQRRKRAREYSQQDQNLRAAIEATCWAVKCRYPNDKFPVRGLFRMTSLLIASAAMNNVRRIDRHLHARPWQIKRKLAKQAVQRTLAAKSSFLFGSPSDLWPVCRLEPALAVSF